MTCKETTRMICAYIEGRLSPPVADDVQQHLDECRNCQLVLDAARQTLEMYFGDATDEPALGHRVRVA